MKPVIRRVGTNMQLPPIPLSILDRANARDGAVAEALGSTLQRAKQAEQLGYHRFWVAEHHGVPGIAGSAPTVLMAVIAAQTERIRVGSGGVMLPNHQPLVVAEQAATLQAIFPGRIDLGIGRSVGFTSTVRRALRQDKDAGDHFEEDLAELLSYLSGSAAMIARPFDGGATPPFVLATGKGADIAAAAGLAVVVGGPTFTGPGTELASAVLDRYRKNFRPSMYYAEPYVILSANVAVAETTQAARDVLMPEAWAMAQARTQGQFPPLEPTKSIQEQAMTPRQRNLINEALDAAIYGTANDVAEELSVLLEVLKADELMVTTNTFDTATLADTDGRLAALFGLG